MARPWRFQKNMTKRRTYRPGDGTRVFAVRYQWPGFDPVWETVGAEDENDASEHVAEAQSTVFDERPLIIKTVELFFDPKSGQYQPALSDATKTNET
jgi:hypothetical protein